MTALELHHLPLARAAEARGAVVVVDVLRAFTTAAHALARGAVEIRMVVDVDEAFRLREADPDVLLMGEVEGRPVPGFDLPNSPAAVSRASLAGRRVVHRTTAGTRGAVAAARAEVAFAASFVVAEATVAALRLLAPAGVTFVITGEHSGRDGDEDRACADYLTARLTGGPADTGEVLERVRTSDAAQRFLAGDDPAYPAADVSLACELDRFDRALPISWVDGAPILR